MLSFIFISQSVAFSQTWAQNGAESQNTFPHAIIVTLYVHGGGIDGPALRAVSVISNDGAGLGSEGITNSEGYITLKGTSGTWQFTISSDNCAKTESKSMYIGDSGKVDLYFSQIEGKCVTNYAPGFFSRVLSEVGIPYSDFASNALENWANCEFTNAMWNPLATTWTSGIDASLRSDFNSNGGYPVQNYLAENIGIEATASTLKLTYYKSIVDMLKLKAFDEQGIRSGLETWGGSGYEDTLVSEWQKAYLANAPTTQPSESSVIGKWDEQSETECVTTGSDMPATTTNSRSHSILDFHNDGTVTSSQLDCHYLNNGIWIECNVDAADKKISTGEWVQQGDTVRLQFSSSPTSTYDTNGGQTTFQNEGYTDEGKIELNTMSGTSSGLTHSNYEPSDSCQECTDNSCHKCPGHSHDISCSSTWTAFRIGTGGSASPSAGENGDQDEKTPSTASSTLPLGPKSLY